MVKRRNLRNCSLRSRALFLSGAGIRTGGRGGLSGVFPLLYPVADRNLADGRSLLYGAVFWMEDYHGN